MSDYCFTIKEKCDCCIFNELIKDINNKNELYEYVNGLTLYMLCKKVPYNTILNKRMNVIIDYFIYSNNKLKDNKDIYINYFKNNIIDNFKNISISEYAKIHREYILTQEEDDDKYSVDSDVLLHYRSKFPTQEMLKEYYQNLYKRQSYYHDDNDYDIKSDNLDNNSECESIISYDNENYDDELEDDFNNEYYTDDEY